MSEPNYIALIRQPFLQTRNLLDRTITKWHW